jgi:hypothetical protein
MITKQIRFICAQPAIDYYAWQVEVIINNFISMGINPNYIDIVCWKENGNIPENWSKLADYYNTVRFFFYDDTRITKNYISSIRPNILKQHWQARPEVMNDVIFYHDNDIVFTKPIDWEKLINDDKWYGSDTRWYISHDYIISKGEDVLDKMCEIVGIDKQIIKDNELNCIGAQYLMKDIDWKFWDNVERDSERLFKEITELNDQKIIEDRHTMPPSESRTPYHPLQIWTADMWAILWNGWKLGKQTVCHDDLQFSWATSSEEDWNKYNIFHNAGVTDDKDGLFYKANYMNKLPYNEKLDIKPNTASWHYWNIIQETAKKSCLL